MNSVAYVGMDVDSEKIVVAKLAGGSGSNAEEQVIANKPAAVKKYFASLLQSNVSHNEVTAPDRRGVGCATIGRR